MPEERFIYPHEADPDIFREALAYSEADKGFTSNLIEKDYYCSLILQYFFSEDTELVFKGGTCLSKVHADFKGFNMEEAFKLVSKIAEALSA